MAANRNVDDEVDEVEEEEEEEAPRRSNPFRLILLVLLALVGICVICFLGAQVLGTNNILSALPFQIPGISSQQPAATETPPVAVGTPAVVPTEDLVGAPPVETSPAATEQPLVEPPVVTEEPVGTEAAPVEEPTAEATAEQPVVATEAPVEEAPTVPPTEAAPTAEPTVEPTQELIDEHGAELPTQEPGAPTTEAVPGPIATPTLSTAPSADCANNVDPVADAGGPYDAMMGKGEAMVILDGNASSDPDGLIVSYEWDLGDGSSDTGQSVTHGYASTGSFVATLTVTDNCGAVATATADITITGPTPPAATPAPTGDSGLPPTGQVPPLPPGSGNYGFCYRVQYGDTLSGLAWYFGVPWPDLALVNAVHPEYYVIEGQGLFIPTGPIQPGPNLYLTETGDTLYSIAYQCGLPVTTLAAVNGLSPDEALSPGQAITIPPCGWY